MRQLSVIVALCVFVTFVSCKGKDKKTETEQTTTEQSQTGSSDASAPGGSREEKNERWEKRKAKGDTLAMPYKDLEAYLPDISGYTKDGGPQGSQTNIPGAGNWATAEQNYTNGDKHIKVSMVDYNASFQSLQGLTAAYKMGWSSEDDNQKQQKVDLGVNDAAAYETIYKKDKHATMAIVVADRFMISIDMTGDNDEGNLKNVAKSINLGKLAEM